MWCEVLLARSYRMGRSHALRDLRERYQSWIRTRINQRLAMEQQLAEARAEFAEQLMATRGELYKEIDGLRGELATAYSELRRLYAFERFHRADGDYIKPPTIN